MRVIGGGGINPAVLDRCFGRVSNWLQVLRHTVKAECPEFDLLMAFEMFNLEYDMQPHIREDHLCKLGKAFGVPQQVLGAQLLDVWPLAQTYR